jgi:hypothetical protein
MWNREDNKRRRLQEKRAHIQEQIEALTDKPDTVVGKMNAILQTRDEEIKFQQWRLGVIDELFEKSVRQIKAEIKQMERTGRTFTVLDRVVYDLLRFSVEEAG